jgi:hypothetical protein
MTHRRGRQKKAAQRRLGLRYLEPAGVRTGGALLCLEIDAGAPIETVSPGSRREHPRFASPNEKARHLLCPDQLRLRHLKAKPPPRSVVFPKLGNEWP